MFMESFSVIFVSKVIKGINFLPSLIFETLSSGLASIGMKIRESSIGIACNMSSLVPDLPIN